VNPRTQRALSSAAAARRHTSLLPPTSRWESNRHQPIGQQIVPRLPRPHLTVPPNCHLSASVIALTYTQETYSTGRNPSSSEELGHPAKIDAWGLSSQRGPIAFKRMAMADTRRKFGTDFREGGVRLVRGVGRADAQVPDTLASTRAPRATE
jgi:hypothetical protein